MARGDRTRTRTQRENPHISILTASFWFVIKFKGQNFTKALAKGIVRGKEGVHHHQVMGRKVSPWQVFWKVLILILMQKKRTSWGSKTTTLWSCPLCQRMKSEPYLVCKIAKGDKAPVLKCIQECSNPKSWVDSHRAESCCRSLSLGAKWKRTKALLLPKMIFSIWSCQETPSKPWKISVAGLATHGKPRNLQIGFWKAAVRNQVFEQMKHHPKLQLTIDRYRKSSSSLQKGVQGGCLRNSLKQ